MLWRNGLPACCLLASLALLGGCKEEQVSVGAPAPALAAYDLAGQAADPSRWRGKRSSELLVRGLRRLPGGNGDAGETQPALRR